MTFISIFFSGVFKFLLNILTFKWQLTWETLNLTNKNNSWITRQLGLLCKQSVINICVMSIKRHEDDISDFLKIFSYSQSLLIKIIFKR